MMKGTAKVVPDSTTQRLKQNRSSLTLNQELPRERGKVTADRDTFCAHRPLVIPPVRLGTMKGNGTDHGVLTFNYAYAY